ncbi:SpoIID/LytB domain-containing protein [Metabacillus malikii]|uniref:SpoIID/LytB domain protein n=1 Tax=Metabacillus malikii TaxID=1504265 RepID=A0ABT9ZCK8_9BACI|nr:SpoIID/LytB domain-containing protein [Metabacillus malikii]MDQ0229994.1 SpoIID/LytB domain protein [Metabacillus malikii]
MKKIILLSLSLLFLYPFQARAEDLVRVKLVQHIGESSQLTFRVSGQYQILGETVPLKENITYKLTMKGGKFVLKEGNRKGEALMSDTLVLLPKRYDYTHQVSINDRPYLGAMEFIKEKNNTIRPVNQLPVEDYLKGVVPFEVYPSWGIETLKAQTLAARTYAISHINDDLDDTIKFQVYGGFTWSESTTKAVNDTKGEVITYNDRLIDAFYSASNGGITENNAHVWGAQPKSYFPIKEDQYDPVNPWKFKLHKTQINLNDQDELDDNWWENAKEKDTEITNSMKKYLQANGYPGEIKILSIPMFEVSSKTLKSKRSTTGSIKVEFLQRLIDGTILYDEISFNQVNLNKIRPLIGGNLFKSYFIDSLTVENDAYVMKGRGFGHGVGMSQWGAHYMGVSGNSYQQIIDYYYPGTKIKQVDNLMK